MKFTKKRADELVEGDIIVSPAQGRRVVLINRTEGRVSRLTVGTLGLGTTTLFLTDCGKMYDVEALELTPAQEHAEDLRLALQSLLLLDRRSGWFSREGDAAAALLAKIDPPAPVTLGEALAALKAAGAETMTTEEYGAFIDRAREVLERAVKAGQL